MGAFVRAPIENQSQDKHVESLKTRRLDEGSNPSDSTKRIKKEAEWLPFLILYSSVIFRMESFHLHTITLQNNIQIGLILDEDF